MQGDRSEQPADDRGDRDELPVRVQSAPPSRLRRSTRLSALGAIAAAVLVVVLAGAIFATRGALTGARTVPSATATAILAPGSDTIVFVDGAPWGALTIDGRQVTKLANPWHPVTLNRGRHPLTYVAPPFPALACTISAPAAGGDTCPLTSLSGVFTAPANPDAAPGTPVPSYPDATRIVDLGASPHHLSTYLFKALFASTQQALDAFTSSSTIAPGDHYATADGKVAVAAATFKVTLNFRLLSPQETPRSIPCDPFCVGAGGTPSLVAGLHLTIFPVMQWQYTPPGSAEITSRQGPSAGSNVDISVNWSGGAWQVAVSPTMPNSAALEDALLLFPPASSPGGSYGTVGAALASPPAAGSVTLDWGSNGDQAHAGIVLYHNGVVLAANEAARQLFPTMTVAGRREAAFAAQLASVLPR